MQLLITACIFWRATMYIAGMSTIALWFLALCDYDLFHLFESRPRPRRLFYLRRLEERVLGGSSAALTTSALPRPG